MLWFGLWILWFEKLYVFLLDHDLRAFHDFVLTRGLCDEVDESLFDDGV
jgi:hypothetical protein